MSATNVPLLRALAGCHLNAFLSCLNAYDGPVGEMQVDENESILISASKYALNSEISQLSEFVRRLRYVEILFNLMSDKQPADRMALTEAQAFLSKLLDACDEDDDKTFMPVFKQRLSSLSQVLERPFESQRLQPISKDAFVVAGFGIRGNQFVRLETGLENDR